MGMCKPFVVVGVSQLRYSGGVVVVSQREVSY
jgi:hypothetical protein